MARADEAPTREYIVDERLPPASTRWKLTGGGLGATAAFYGVAQPFSYIWPDSPGALYLRYPVAGPWMALAHDGCLDTDPDCSIYWRVARGVLEALDGLGQAGGLAVALEGIFLPTSSDSGARPPSPSRQRRQPAAEPPENSPGNLFYVPRPIVIGQRGVGVGVVGVF